MFEVLASGALLTISMPNELTELGFQDEVHLSGIVMGAKSSSHTGLSDGRNGTSVHHAGSAHQDFAGAHLRARVEQLLGHLERIGSAELAPARHWPEHRVRLMYLDSLHSSVFSIIVEGNASISSEFHFEILWRMRYSWEMLGLPAPYRNEP